jgi:hypothetical protein
MNTRLWLDFLFTVFVRTFVGGLLGCLGFLLLFWQGILWRVADNDTRTPVQGMVVGAIIGAVLMLGGTPRWQTPWRGCEGWNTERPCIGFDWFRILFAGVFAFLLFSWVRHVLAAGRFVLVWQLKHSIIRQETDPIFFWFEILLWSAIGVFCLAQVVIGVRNIRTGNYD